MNPSLRQAINAKCRDCIFDPAVGGNWRKQTHACTVTSCPLWFVRPLSRAQGAAQTEDETDPCPTDTLDGE